jgi:surface antigen
MPRQRLRPVLLALLLAVPATGWSSSGLLWMHNSPVRYFNDADWELARANLHAALDEAADGEKREWSNPDTGNHGSATPGPRTEADGMTCRDVQIRNFAKRLDGGGTFPFCRQADGTWKLQQQ